MTANQSARQIALGMMGSIKDESAIINYIKWLKGDTITKDDLRRWKRDHSPSEKKLVRQKKVEPVSFWAPKIEVPFNDPLLTALEKHHLGIVIKARREARMMPTPPFVREGQLRRLA
jgi:hypothetical protein